MFKYIILIVALLISHNNIYALCISRPIGNDPRIKIINYTPNCVVMFMGHYTYHSIIEFALDEKITNITMGTPTAWMIKVNENRIFLKPIAEDAVTNMTVITNKRMYFFEMHAEFAANIADDNIAFIMKFIYPDNNASVPVAINTGFVSGPDLSKPQLYNFNYKISGPAKNIEPILIFDDGKFTYFKFQNINTNIPAIFLVNDDNTEALINYRVTDGYIVVERVNSRFTLRSGYDVLCVFNEQIYQVKTNQ